MITWSPLDRLPEALGLPPGTSYACIVGAGGKTTLMFTLARLLLRRGDTVITTTSTRILEPDGQQSPAVLLSPRPPGDLARIARALARWKHITLARARDSGNGKLLGFSPAQLDDLWDSGLARHLLVEADGSAGLPFKFPSSREPVVSSRTGTLLVVVGARCLGSPLDGLHVHRASLLRSSLGIRGASQVTAGMVARAMLHPDGYLRALPPGARLAVVLSTGPATTGAAVAIARALAERDREGLVDRILLADLLSRTPRFALAPGRA